MKNDNNGEDGEKKKRTEDLRFRLGSTVRKKSEKCRPAKCGAHTPSGGNSRHVTAVEVWLTTIGSRWMSSQSFVIVFK